MIVNVPFFYDLIVKLPRRPNTHAFLVRDTHPVMLREVEDAVHVAEIPRNTFLDDLSDNDDVYFWNDRWWHPVRTNVSQEPNRRVDVAETIKSLEEDGKAMGVTLFGRQKPWRDTIRDTIEEIGAREIVSSTKADMIADIEKNTENYVLIGGEIMRPCSEPMIIASIERKHAGPGYFLYAKHGYADNLYNRDAMPYNRWRLDEYDRMMASMKAIKRRGEVDLETSLQPAIVHRPDLLTWDRERSTFWHFFDSDMRRVLDHDHAESSVERFAKFAALRDASRSLDRSSDETIHELVVMAQAVRVEMLDPERAYDADGWFGSTLRSYAEFTEHCAQQDHLGDALSTIGMQP